MKEKSWCNFDNNVAYWKLYKDIDEASWVFQW